MAFEPISSVCVCVHSRRKSKLQLMVGGGGEEEMEGSEVI